MKKRFWMICAAVLAASLPAYAEEPVEQTVDWSVFMIDDPETYVTLGDYLDLEVTKTMYTVTDEDVQIELDSRISSYATTKETDRDPQLGDIITMDVTFTVDGETLTEEGFQIEYGYAYLGDDFDEGIEGIHAGETRSFTVTYDDYAEIEGWENKTVIFEVTATRVEMIVTPELTDEWVQENTEYEDLDAFKKSVGDKLQAEFDRQSTQDAYNTVLEAAMEDATFHDYPDEMYDAAYNMSLSQYTMMADMFGMTLEELYDNYDMTDEDLEDEAVEQINNYLLINAIAKEENITVEDGDVEAYAEANYEDYGYLDAANMLEESDKEELTVYTLQDKVCAFLLENADVTVEEVSSDEAEYDLDDSSAIDLDWDDEDWNDDEWEEDDTDDMAEFDWSDMDWGDDGEDEDDED